MKKFTNCLLLLFLLGTFANIVLAQKMSNEEKLKLLDKQIEETEAAKTTGMWMAIGGAAAQIAGWALYDATVTSTYSSSSGWDVDEPDNTLTWILVGAGAVASIWGVYKWWDNANELSMLKEKRIEYSFSPSVIPTPNKQVAYGVTINIKF